MPGNNCEGGESQVIQFPAERTAYLQAGGPHGTTIQYCWPDNPRPTGEYTKWQLRGSIQATAGAASTDALKMILAASNSVADKLGSPDLATKTSLRRQLEQAWEAWWLGTVTERSTKPVIGRTSERFRKVQMALWGSAYTDYATAQLYA